MSTALLLDTCALIWLMNGDPLSPESRAAIRAAQQGQAGVYVSPISAWEVSLLVSRNRLQLSLAPSAWFERSLGLPGVRLAPMPPAVLIASNFLPGQPPKDPADRILAATAREQGWSLVTRDGELVPYGRLGHLDLIEC